MSDVSLFVAAATVALSFVAAWFFSSRPRISYLWDCGWLLRLDEETPAGDLSIYVGNTRVRDLGFANLVIWNTGNTVFDESSFTSEPPVVIDFGKNKVVHCFVQKVSRPTVRASLAAEDESSTSLVWDTFDKNDAILCTFLLDMSESVEWKWGSFTLDAKCFLKGLSGGLSKGIPILDGLLFMIPSRWTRSRIPLPARLLWERPEGRSGLFVEKGIDQ